jgi:hypothetical protein
MNNDNQKAEIWTNEEILKDRAKRYRKYGPEVALTFLHDAHCLAREAQKNKKR